MASTINRRDFIKSAAVASAASVAGLSVPTNLLAKADDVQKSWKWDKAVCRFCGTGCGIMVATKNGSIVAIKGDPEAPVNRGINCIKGYFCAKIMYGADRLTQPLLRVNSKGEFDKKGKFVPISWKQAFDVMEQQFRKAYEKDGPNAVGLMASGQYTIPEGYAALKLFKAGFRSNNIDPNARHCMASAVVGFMQTFGIDDVSQIDVSKIQIKLKSSIYLPIQTALQILLILKLSLNQIPIWQSGTLSHARLFTIIQKPLILNL